MKKLICANEVKEAAQKGQKVFYIDSCTIITPSAKDLAKDLGVEFTDGSTPAEKNYCQENKPQKDVNQRMAIDRDVIYQVVKAVLANRLLTNASGPVLEMPFLTEGDPGSGLKIVRGRNVKFKPFDTGDPNTKVMYRDVVNKEHAQLSAGFLTIEKSSFGWELCYEEMGIVLEGSLSIAINGKTYEASQGDVLFLPKGSKVTWCSSGYAKLFYVTYPANCSELMV